MTQARESAPVRVARSVVLAAVASGCSSVAHAAAGGHTASGPALLVTLLLVGALALPLVQGPSTIPRTMALLMGLQVVAHVGQSLSMAASAATAGGGPALSMHAAHAGHASAMVRSGGNRHLTDSVTGIGAPAGGMGGMDTSVLGLLPSPTMLACHLLAALFLAWCLMSGERSWVVACGLFSAASAPLRSLIPRLVCALVTVPPSTTHGLSKWSRSITMLPRPRTDVWVSPARARRGPPGYVTL